MSYEVTTSSWTLPRLCRSPREMSLAKMDVFLRDVFGVKRKRIPECLLRPLPMLHDALERLREKGMQDRHPERCSGRLGGLAKVLSVEERNSLKDFSPLASERRGSDVPESDFGKESGSVRNDGTCVLEGREEERGSEVCVEKRASLPNAISESVMPELQECVKEEPVQEGKREAESETAESVKSDVATSLEADTPSHDDEKEDMQSETLVTAYTVGMAEKQEEDLAQETCKGSSPPDSVVSGDESLSPSVSCPQMEEGKDSGEQPMAFSLADEKGTEPGADQASQADGEPSSTETKTECVAMALEELSTPLETDPESSRAQQIKSQALPDAEQGPQSSKETVASEEQIRAENAEKDSLKNYKQDTKSPAELQAHFQYTEELTSLLKAYQPQGSEAEPLSPLEAKEHKKLIDLAQKLKENVDQIYDQPPTLEEIHDFAQYLGMDVEKDSEFLYIAEWAMTAPLPAEWSVHLDSAGNEYFYSSKSRISQYEHPMDQTYRQLYQSLKQLRQHH